MFRTSMPQKALTVLGVLVALTASACDPPEPVAPSLAIGTAVITRMAGTGAVGNGSPTYYGQDRQWFDLEVSASGGAVSGRLDYVDSAFVKDDGNFPHLVAGPGWPGTAIASFAQTSAGCVEFEGVGRLLNTNELLAFRVETCDNGRPGAGLDLFAIYVPQRLLSPAGSVYRVGPLSLTYGELTASSIPAPMIELP